jgi:hypothetical protein
MEAIQAGASQWTFYGSCVVAAIKSASHSGCSAPMISTAQRTHSSQMKADGPAISVRTSVLLLPQKEQRGMGAI